MPQVNEQPEADRSAPKAMVTQTEPVALIRLLDEFARGDEAEQRETFESLKRALDEGRRPGYKLFTAK
jgi:hypothetical protein